MNDIKCFYGVVEDKINQQAIERMIDLCTTPRDRLHVSTLQLSLFLIHFVYSVMPNSNHIEIKGMGRTIGNTRTELENQQRKQKAYLRDID